jgi:hypothetical protein
MTRVKKTIVGAKKDHTIDDQIAVAEPEFREDTPDISKIYCFGDSLTFMKFNIGPMIWG